MNKFTPVSSIVAPVLIDNIDTDQIIPAEFLKVTNKLGLGEHLFQHWRQDATFSLNQSQYQGSQILLSGENFGCGSSREHAPWALLDYGFKVVIAKSFADIFKNNAYNNGLLPIAVPTHVHQQILDQVVTVDLQNKTIQWLDQQYSFDVNNFNQQRLLNGIDAIGYTLQFNELITAYEQAHPRTAR